MRVVLNKFKLQIEAYHYNLAINQFLKPVYRSWLDLSILAGSLLPGEARTEA